MITRFFALAVALLLSMASVAPAAQAVPPTPLNLRDVPATDRDRAAIEYLHRHEVIAGHPNGTFLPDAPVTRGELLKIALEASGKGREALFAERSGRFPDVAPAHTLGTYIAYAAAQGHVSGYPDGSFLPNAQVSRGEAAKILANVLGAPQTRGPHPYTDVGATTLLPFIERLHQANWFRPVGIQFRPDAPALRRDVARIAYRGIVSGAAQAAVYAPTLTAPATRPTDWQHVERGAFSMLLPPAWWSDARSMPSEVGDFPTLVAAPSEEHADAPIFLYTRMPASSFQGIEDIGDAEFSEPVLRMLAVDTPAGARTINAVEMRNLREDMLVIGWVSGETMHLVVYNEPGFPGLAGTFRRFAQYAAAATH